MHGNSTAPAVTGKSPARKTKPPDTSATPAKPEKPYADFPLFAHATKRWAKKIRGKLVYFGPWDDPDGALAKYLEHKNSLHAGRKPRQGADSVTVKDMVNVFLNAKASARDAGEIARRTFDDYKQATDVLVTHFGKRRLVADLGPDDFAALHNKLAKKWGPRTLGNTINRIRVVLKHASDNNLIDRPIALGSSFKRPSKKTLRLDRAKKGAKLFRREEILRLVDVAGVQLKAMILLGINAGFGNADCGALTSSVVDLDRDIIDYPRPKAGIPRRAPLWPETVQAIRDAIAARPEPKKPEHAALVFITKYGQPWAKLSSDN